MKKLIFLTIISILSQIFTANICLGNSENSDGFLSGCAWLDDNKNSIQELNEINIADVTVFVEDIDTGKLVTAKTDASGFFTVTEMSYGRYSVWSENMKGVATLKQIIELSEVNGAALLDFAFTPVSVPSFYVFLPIINR